LACFCFLIFLRAFLSHNLNFSENFNFFLWIWQAKKKKRKAYLGKESCRIKKESKELWIALLLLLLNWFIDPFKPLGQASLLWIAEPWFRFRTQFCILQFMALWTFFLYGMTLFLVGFGFFCLWINSLFTFYFCPNLTNLVFHENQDSFEKSLFFLTLFLPRSRIISFLGQMAHYGE
jgi:hypothetical protein